MSELHFYNSYTRQKEKFEPITPGYAGLYVCGPTVSGESHLGHARPYITFDVVQRYLKHLGYKVRYVRNITDAGHFEEEGREAIDKVGEKAKLEKLEPMEMVQKYTNMFHKGMHLFNCQDPAIEPTATGHILEQIEMIKKIIKKKYAYVSNGSVYFDVKKYAKKYAKSNNPYGKLSGRKLENLLENTRELDGQDEKRNRVDFALWKKAPPEHIQRWNSPWGEGFPGWHIECSAMSSKYLGETFDIHGGGMDLMFPHHESEIAQSTIAHGHPPVRYWMHNNMITINGKKMGKSYNNVIKLSELFSGNHPILEQPYHPMVVRFYILQTHYGSTLDFSNEALQASERAFRRLWEAYEVSKKIEYGSTKRRKLIDSLLKSSPNDRLDDKEKNELIEILGELDNHVTLEIVKHQGYVTMQTTNQREILINAVNTFISSGVSSVNYGPVKTISEEKYKNIMQIIVRQNDYLERSISMHNSYKSPAVCQEAMNDDFNTAKVIVQLWEYVTAFNNVKSGKIEVDYISKIAFEAMKSTFKTYLEDILGMQAMQVQQSSKLDNVLSLLIEIRNDSKKRKDFATSDQIRNKLAEAGVLLKDEKDGTVSYTIE
jgi:cysteinyl-tRNA synthetase